MRSEGKSKAYQVFGVLEQTEGRMRLLGAAVVERGKEGVAGVGTATGTTRRDQALLGLVEGEVR